jgi:branched-chain amino acid transport system ATP-binding protein
MEPLLAVRSLSHRFGGLQALDDVSLDLFPGEILGIIGPNGAGKSTLFGAITGSVRADRGEVRFAGKPIGGLMPEAIARLGVARTFQTPRPFQGMRFVDNVLVGALSRTHRLRDARKAALECLERVGLLPWADVPAQGASTGQRKRLDIARAVATRPRVLLLDEPLGGLDPGSIASLMDLLKDLRGQGLTLIVIEHNLAAVRQLVDRLMALNLGRNLAEGAPDAVIREPAVVRAYLGGGGDDHA